jgi:hypothetical protein
VVFFSRCLLIDERVVDAHLGSPKIELGFIEA